MAKLLENTKHTGAWSESNRGKEIVSSSSKLYCQSPHKAVLSKLFSGMIEKWYFSGVYILILVHDILYGQKHRHV